LTLTGLTAGLALFHNFSSLIVISLLVFVHFGACGFRRFISDIIRAFPFFLIGVLPLIVVNLLKGAVGFYFFEAKFMDSRQLSFSWINERLYAFFFEHLPKSGCYEDLFVFSGKVADYAWVFCFLAAYLFAAPYLLKSFRIVFLRIKGTSLDHVFQDMKTLPFLLYLPILAMGFAAGNFKIGGYQPPVEIGGYRYFLTHFLFSIILISIVFSRLYRETGVKRILGVILAVISLTTGLFNLNAADLSFSKTLMAGWRYDGYCHLKYARGLYRDEYKDNPQLIQSAIKDFNPAYRRHVYYGIGALKALMAVKPLGKPLFADLSKMTPLFRLQNFNAPEMLKDIPKEYRIDAARGFGAYLRVVIQVKTLLKDTDVVKKITKRLSANPSEYNAYIIEGLSLNREFILERESLGFFIETEKIAEQFKKFSHYIRRGEGVLAGRLLKRGIPTEQKLIKALARVIPKRDKAPFFFGMGWGFADKDEKPHLPLSFLESAPEGMRDMVYAGFVSAVYHIYGSEDCLKILKSHKDYPPCSYLEAVKNGMFWKGYPATGEKFVGQRLKEGH